MYNYDLIKEKLYTKNLGKTFVQFEEVSSLHGKSKNISENCPDGMLILSEKQSNIKSKDNKVELPHDIDLVLLSVIFKTKKDCSDEMLQIATASVCEVLSLLCDETEFKIKWPKEVHFEGKKICEVLVEKHTKKNVESLILSMYINYKTADAKKDSTEDEVSNNTMSSIMQITKEDFSKEELIAEILNKIEELYEEFMITKQQSSAMGIFDKKNIYDSRKVLINKIGKKTKAEAIVIGIDKKGRLIVSDESESKKYLEPYEYEVEV